MFLDLFLIASLGFLGSFGHCVGMCGPLTVAFGLAQRSAPDPVEPEQPGVALATKDGEIDPQVPPSSPPAWGPQVRFHLALNLGRLLSYVLVGITIGGVGSVLVASGQVAGVDSDVRRVLALVTGTLLIWLGLRQLKPDWLPPLPHWGQVLHQRLQQGMTKLAAVQQGWTPWLLGGLWGLIPCGFLYTAQIKAAETGSWWLGGATMLAFGLGTLPTMVGVGLASARVSQSRRDQLYRLGGWVTLTIGVLTLWRTDAMMADLTGHLALLLLAVALVARPVSRLWAGPLRYRRLLGVGSFGLAIAHAAHMIGHALGGRWRAFFFLLEQHQWAMVAGMIALLLLLPPALTSTDRWQRHLGRRWRSLHLLSVPALGLAVGHSILIGSHYLGGLQWTSASWVRTGALLLGLGTVLLLRWRRCWLMMRQGELYVEAPIFRAGHIPRSPTTAAAHCHTAAGSQTTSSRPHR